MISRNPFPAASQKLLKKALDPGTLLFKFEYFMNHWQLDNVKSCSAHNYNPGHNISLAPLLMGDKHDV